MVWTAYLSGNTETPVQITGKITEVKVDRNVDNVGTATITLFNPRGVLNGEFITKYLEPITIHAAKYDAAYLFDTDTIGSVPSGWTGDSGYVKVDSDPTFGKVVIGNGNNTEAVSLSQVWASSHIFGAIECWMKISVDNSFYIYVSDGGWATVPIQIWLNHQLSGIYCDSNGTQKICDLTSNTYYHIRVTFDCSNSQYDGLETNTFFVYINGKKYGPYHFTTPVTSLDRVFFTPNTTNWACYLARVDYSWASHYMPNRNYMGYRVFSGRIEDVKIQNDNLLLMCADFSKELKDNDLDQQSLKFSEGIIPYNGINTQTSTFTNNNNEQWTENVLTDKRVRFTEVAPSSFAILTGQPNTILPWEIDGTKPKTVGNTQGTVDNLKTETNFVSYVNWAITDTGAGYAAHVTFPNIQSGNSMTINHIIQPYNETGALYIRDFETSTWSLLRSIPPNSNMLFTERIDENVAHYISGGTNGPVLLKFVPNVRNFYGEYQARIFWYFAECHIKTDTGMSFQNGLYEVWKNNATTATLKYHHHPGTGEVAGFPLISSTGEYPTYIPTRDDTGNLMATFNFASDAIDGDPAGWTITENDDATIKVKANIGGLARAVDHYDDGSGYTVMYDDFTAQTDAAIEFWARADAAYNLEISLKNAATARIYLYFQWATSKLSYHNGAALVDIADIALNTNYHCRLVFNCASDTYDVFLNGYQKGTGCPFYSAATNLDRVQFYWNTNAPGGHCYIGAVDYSWDTDTGQYQVPYFVNRNRWFARQCAFGGYETNPIGSHGVSTGDQYTVLDRSDVNVNSLISQQSQHLVTGSTIHTGNVYSDADCRGLKSHEIITQLASEEGFRVFVDLQDRPHYHRALDGTQRDLLSDTGTPSDFTRSPTITYSTEELITSCRVYGKDNIVSNIVTGTTFNGVNKQLVIRNDAIVSVEEANSYASGMVERYNQMQPAVSCEIADHYDLDIGEQWRIETQHLTGDYFFVEGIHREWKSPDSGVTIATIRLGNLPSNLEWYDKLAHYVKENNKAIRRVNVYK